MPPRLSARDADPGRPVRFDTWVHGDLERRDFVAKAQTFAHAGATAAGRMPGHPARLARRRRTAPRRRGCEAHGGTHAGLLQARALVSGTPAARPGWLPAIDTGRCTGCGWCVAACADLHLLSLEALRWDKRAVLHDAQRCTGCSLCAVRCPVHAITMRKAGATMARLNANPVSAMSETERPPLPDRLSTDPASPHHVAALMQHDIGIRINGQERHDVEEYCVSEGWIKVPAGRTVDRRGRPLLIKLKGVVEPYYR